MSNDAERSTPYVPPSSREGRVREMSLSPEQFAAKTGATLGFTPAHARGWMEFWKQDICENDDFYTYFPRLTLPEARQMWLAIEEHFFARYHYFLRVWPEWGSNGIWSVPYPGSRSAGGMIDYQRLPLPVDLEERFKNWLAEYDLKRCVGPPVHVEFRELIEVLPDGTTRSWRQMLGLPDRFPPIGTDSNE